VSSDIEFAAGGTSAVLLLKPSPRARLMRLKVDSRTGTVTLTYPSRASRRKAIEWARQQQGWVESMLAQIPAPTALAPGAIIPIEGRPHAIDWSPARPRSVLLAEGRICVGGPAETLELRLIRWLVQHARNVLQKETAEFAGYAGVSVTRVGVGDPLSRWGSCSSSGAIRYSWRLILAPDWVRRATVAHEVAHRVHMNHGPDFHALVRRLLGADPKPAREWLRREGAGLHRIGGRR
jgi:predicted metal-dependent hydrolase